MATSVHQFREEQDLILNIRVTSLVQGVLHVESARWLFGVALRNHNPHDVLLPRDAEEFSGVLLATAGTRTKKTIMSVCKVSEIPARP